MELNVTKLTEVAKASHTAQVVLIELGLRDRLRHTTDLGRFRNKLLQAKERIIETDYMQTFKDLESLGIGSISYGRGKNPTKFIWNYNLREIGKLATEGRTTTTEIPKKIEAAPVVPTREIKSIQEAPKKKRGRPRKVPAAISNTPILQESTSNKFICVPLPNGKYLDISVPLHLSKAEIETVLGALRHSMAA